MLIKSLKSMVVFFLHGLFILEALAVSNERFQHLPYALRNRYSGSLTRRSLAETNENAIVSSTKPSSTNKNNMNYFVTHHIEDIESFFDDNLEGQTESSNSNSLPVEDEQRVSAHHKNHKHYHNHHNRHNHNTTAGIILKAHSTKKQKQISQKRTIKNPLDYQASDYVTAVVGKDVQLDCKIKNIKSEDERILWMRMPKGEILAFNTNRVTNDPRINSVCGSNLSPSCSLTLSDTRESDTGFYACQTNDMKSKYVYLDIMVPPKLLTNYPGDRLDVNQSSNVSITCEFYGKPQPLVKWYKYQHKQQREIESFRGLKTIDVFIGPDSPNEYECVADNSIPPVISKKISLNIQYPPMIKFQNSRIFQKRGERVIFDCSIQANPEARVFWYKNKTRLSESPKYNIENIDNKVYRLYVNNLTENDFGDYHCTATNLAGESTSKIELLELPIMVEEKPEIKIHLSNPIKQINLGNTNNQNQKKLIKQTSTEDFELQTVFDSKSEEITLKHNASRNRVSEGYSINANEVHMIGLPVSSTRPAPMLIKAHSNPGLPAQSQLDSKNPKNLRNSFKLIHANKNANSDDNDFTKNVFDQENEPNSETYKLNGQEDAIPHTQKKIFNHAQVNSTKSRNNKPPFSRSNNHHHHHRNQSDDTTINKKSNVRKSGGGGNSRKSYGHQAINNIPAPTTPSSSFFPVNDDEVDHIILTDSANCVGRQSLFVYLILSIITTLLVPYL